MPLHVVPNLSRHARHQLEISFLRWAFLETADQTSHSDYRPIVIGTRSIGAPLVRTVSAINEESSTWWKLAGQPGFLWAWTTFHVSWSGRTTRIHFFFFSPSWIVSQLWTRTFFSPLHLEICVSVFFNWTLKQEYEGHWTELNSCLFARVISIKDIQLKGTLIWVSSDILPEIHRPNCCYFCLFVFFPPSFIEIVLEKGNTKVESYNCNLGFEC